MKIETKQNKLWRQFLLGVVPDDERIAIEDRFMADGDSFAALEIIESELIEDYLSDDLTVADRVLFESGYLHSAPRRERVARMKILIDEASARKRFIVSSREKVLLGGKIAAFFKYAGWQTAVAASVLILFTVFGAWFLNRQNNNAEVAVTEPVVSQPSAVADSPEMKSPDTANPENSSENKADREIKPSSTATPEKRPTQESETALAVFVLRPVGVRGGAAENRVRVRPQSDEIGLQLELEMESYRYYTARVTTVDGKAIFTSPRLKSNKIGILVRFPTRNVSRGDYIVELAGITPAGKAESVNDYAFTLER